MALTLSHTFETGQTAGTTVTIGNSATGGNAFDSVTINATCTCTYTSTAYRGSLGCAVSSGGTSGQGAVNWTTSIASTPSHAYGRLLVNASAFTVAFPFLRCRGGAAVQVFRLAFTTAGKVEIHNTSNSTIATSATALSTGQWYMIRWDFTVGASSTGTIYIHTDPTSPTATETLPVSSANFGTNGINEYNAGIGASTLNVPTFNFDDIVLTDVALPGPPIQSISISESLTATDTIARTLAASRAAAETLTAADTVARTMIGARSAAESVTVADSIARTLAVSRSAPESITASDSAARGCAMSRTGGESITAGDAVARGLLLPRGAAETLNLVDAAGRVLLLVRAVPESLTAADSVVASLAARSAASGSLASASSAAGLSSTASATGLVSAASAGRLVSRG